VRIYRLVCLGRLRDDRWLSNLTLVSQLGRHSMMGSAGTAKFRQGHNDFRLSLGDTWIPEDWLGVGVRLIIRVSSGEDPRL
jgi:hypothetical protein